jgi:outer membrane protein assembly factor BamE (lipoprotein component of BamABCDE complex)
MTARLCLVVALVAATAGCTRSRVTFGRPVVPAEVAAIVPGVAKAEVLKRLGPPDRVEVETGGSAFEYLYSKAASRSLDVSILQASFNYDQTFRTVDRLRVSFDRAGAVRYVGIVAGDAATP